MLRRFEKKWGGINVRVMLDTNIFISTIFFPSNQTKKLVKRLTENHQIVICDYVIEELRLVTERKFPQKRIFLERFFLELPFELVYTPKVLDLEEFPEMRDTKDSPILATAIMEGIDVFLTGDKDFLVLDVEIPEIMSMAEFLEKF
jgi:putative PIN family toxin of toxin-antitoxin system